MLYFLSNLSNFFGPFRLFKYVTFRAGLATAIAFLLVIFLSPMTIRMLKRLNTTAPSRHKGLIPDQYIDNTKEKTPSMGGILIVFGIVVATFLCANPTNPLMYIFLATTIALAAIGFADDYGKAVYRKRDGIPGRLKLLLEFAIAVGAVSYLFTVTDKSVYMQSFVVPFLREPLLTGLYGTLLTLPLGTLVVVGSSNAVNLTDGKDGLAIGCIAFCAITFAVFAYITGNKIFSDYLFINYLPGAGEVGIFAAAIVGASLGFLWYNCHPASMFMGDTGSLALGGSIGLIAVLLKEELVLILVGGVFVIEALSVIIQVLFFKLSGGKRIFLCAPIHHHFERKGWKETQIVIRFWILGVIFAIMGLATLKLH